ncbi:hypothetical protein ABW21_db0204480 [Orbilia brochopaga]|nr:hypothetical protein ABW21_db0204480 [Drechslerella brochopaga]
MARKVVRPSYAGGPAAIIDEDDENNLYYDPTNPHHASSALKSQSYDQSPSSNSSPASASNSFSDKENTPREPRQRGSHTSPLVKRERSLINQSARATPYAMPASKGSKSAASKASKASTAKSQPSRQSSRTLSRPPLSRATSRVAETPAPDDQDEEMLSDTPSTAHEEEEEEEEEEPMNDGEMSPDATQRSRVSETPGPSRRSRQPLQSQDPSATQAPTPSQRPDVTKFYDPSQSMAERRRVKGAYNEIQQELNDNRAQFIKPGNDGLLHYIQKTGELFKDVKQTGDAVVDGRIQVEIGKLAAEKAKRVGNSGTNTGLEIDEFIAKCMQFMSKSRPGDTSDGHDWAYLGSQIAVPSLKRASPSDFLYGPMAIQKRQRLLKERKKVVRRRLEEFIRPIDLDEKQVAKNENSTTKYVGVVEQTLVSYIANTGEENINYFKFIINPHSYSQTVENMFYLAFLVRDGRVGILEDDDGLLWLCPCEPINETDERPPGGIVRKQIVMPMEKHIWRRLIDAFKITETVIPMRPREVEAINSSGWYS